MIDLHHLPTRSSSCFHKLPLLRDSIASYVELLSGLGYLKEVSITAVDQIFYFVRLTFPSWIQ